MYIISDPASFKKRVSACNIYNSLLSLSVSRTVRCNKKKLPSTDAPIIISLMLTTNYI